MILFTDLFIRMFIEILQSDSTMVQNNLIIKKMLSLHGLYTVLVLDCPAQSPDLTYFENLILLSQVVQTICRMLIIDAEHLSSFASFATEIRINQLEFQWFEPTKHLLINCYKYVGTSRPLFQLSLLYHYDTLLFSLNCRLPQHKQAYS